MSLSAPVLKMVTKRPTWRLVFAAVCLVCFQPCQGEDFENRQGKTRPEGSNSYVEGTKGAGDILGFPVKAVSNLSVEGYDGIIFISKSADVGKNIPDAIVTALQRAAKLDKGLDTEGSILEVNLTSNRLIYAPTGPINMDYDDVRRYSKAAIKGVKRALTAGVKAPLLVLPSDPNFPQCKLVTLLGALEELYVNIQYREDCPEKHPLVKTLGVWAVESDNIEELVSLAVSLESGRVAARDIAGGDPERMAPLRVEEYVRKLFPNGSGVSIEVISDSQALHKEYPLFAAVNRAASVIEHHRGRIILLTYEPKVVNESLFLVGKGVTYDTGGADIKAGGNMAGMSRDKSGAAAVAGFLKVVSLLQPQDLKVVGALCIVRNSVGENCYVADEVIVSRSGKRILVTNTDAEGRLAMADILCHMKELAVNSSNPHLMTIATLTGHASYAVGDGYTIVMDNGAAQLKNSAARLRKAGKKIGDPFEISTLQREDYELHKGKGKGHDLVQASTLPRLPRGHQTPAAFIILASGLDKHGVDCELPLKYSHLDTAASSGNVPDEPTSSPLLALTARYLLQLN